MELLISEIDRFVSSNSSTTGYGNGSSLGNGHGYGCGEGSGNGPGNGDGYGRGDGYGDGYGYSSGNGNGDGFGYSSGNGYGNGNGDGCGYNDAILEINGYKVYSIDGVPTIIESVHGNYAKGYILGHNVLFNSCYIAKYGNYFAHGITLKDAVKDAENKYLRHTSIDRRIEMFHKEFPDYNVKVEANRLFEWHNILTGSCRYGRERFCESKGIDYLNGKYSVNEFIDICKDAYGWDNIKKIL